MNSSSSPFEWLLEHLELDTSLLHVGRYCGDWQASTHGLARASFHLLMDGQCWLHTDEQSIHLEREDAVFLLQDFPYQLSNQATAAQAANQPRISMQPLNQQPGAGAGLVCGFFHFRAGLSQLLLDALPPLLILRAGDPALSAARQLFALIEHECARGESASTLLLERLSHLLFLYVLREHLPQQHSLSGLLGLARVAQFSQWLERMIAHPELPWTLEQMAELCGLSRSAFCKKVLETANTTPGQILLNLRMRLASELLQKNHSVAEVAEQVGYQSVAAFTRAFEKTTASLPGAYRRQFAEPPQAD